MAVKVITDSTSYVSRALRKALDLGVVSLSSLLDGVTYSDDATDYGPFYSAIAQTRSFPTTSQPAVQDVVDLMEERVSGGDDVVGVFISEKMSGTYSAALLARDMVLEHHPQATIEVLDSRSNCMELGFAAIAAARAAAAGGAVAQVVTAANDMIDRTRFLFVPDTLEYLRRGGRIGSASALVGAILRVHPILTVRDGATDVYQKVRTRQRAIGNVVGSFARDLRLKGGLDQVIVHHINDEAAGRELADMIGEVVGRAVDICPIGPAIGAHVGPGTVAVVYSTCNSMGRSS